MNSVLKTTIYGKGNSAQVKFLAELGGMNDEESRMLTLIHKGHSEVYIQQEMCLSRKSYERIEESVRAKLLIAVFHCINKCMDK